MRTKVKIHLEIRFAKKNLIFISANLSSNHTKTY